MFFLLSVLLFNRTKNCKYRCKLYSYEGLLVENIKDGFPNEVTKA